MCRKSPAGVMVITCGACDHHHLIQRHLIRHHLIRHLPVFPQEEKNLRGGPCGLTCWTSLGQPLCTMRAGLVMRTMESELT